MLESVTEALGCPNHNEHLNYLIKPIIDAYVIGSMFQRFKIFKCSKVDSSPRGLQGCFHHVQALDADAQVRSESTFNVGIIGFNYVVEANLGRRFKCLMLLVPRLATYICFKLWFSKNQRKESICTIYI